MNPGWTRIRLRRISGEEEGRLAYLAAKSGLALKTVSDRGLRHGVLAERFGS